MPPFKTDLLLAFIEGQPITPEIARDVLNTCTTSQAAMHTISHAIAAYLDSPWYNLSGAASRKHIEDTNHELFRSLALLDYKVQHLYAETPVASSSEAGKGRDKAPAKGKAMSKHHSMPPPHWAVEVQKSAIKSRQFTTLLRSHSSDTPAAQIEKVYNDMLDVYELQRLNLVAVVGVMRGLLAAFDGGDGTVWKERMAEGPAVGWWLPDCLCDVKPLKKI
ncbi:hypothetical protein P171DRAFT_478986 [Karstenula rhodostoma CBS 690.94]|uniref:Uncharacterized protein n=1 Tax=Karstenula rhodostoma CBS 690.94 TaxID=1392251 RepID=A0A9P4PWW1_9PLEO|nr:hypothetical protein P171DRAFT_478986 [Karstenula rhodostoma CBS 690.94]